MKKTIQGPRRRFNVGHMGLVMEECMFELISNKRVTLCFRFCVEYKIECILLTDTYQLLRVISTQGTGIGELWAICIIC
jgi:hypothetical protein